MHRQSFFKHAAVYGLANLLLQGGGLILLPIYLRSLSSADYGVLEVVGRLAETVGTVLLFGGFRQAMMTFYQQAENETQRRRLVCSALVLYLVSALVGGGLALGVLPDICHRFAPVLTDLTGGGEAPVMGVGLFRLAILGILLEPFSLVPLTLIQARVESVTYVMVVVAQLLLRVTLSIVLVRYLNWGVAGALAATAFTGFVFGLALSARELSRGIALPSTMHIMGLLSFALPLMPGGLCYFVMNHGDRFFLLHFGPPEEVGIYALGYKLAMTVSIFSLSPLYMVWSARMYAAARLPDAPVVFGQMFTRILAVYLLAGLGVCLFGDEAIAILGGARYARASVIIPPVLLGCMCQGAVSLMDAGLYVLHRPGLKLAITLSGTVVMVFFYAVLIPPLGSMGAALATLAGFAFLAGCTWMVTQRVFPVRYEYGRLLLLLVLAVFLWLSSQALRESAWDLYAKVALWLLAPLHIWISGWITADEKDYVRDLVRQLLSVRLPYLVASRQVYPDGDEGRDEPLRAPEEGGEESCLTLGMDLSLTPARSAD
jgi:O-antigen/teichoic acid export membrane protein